MACSLSKVISQTQATLAIAYEKLLIYETLIETL